MRYIHSWQQTAATQARIDLASICGDRFGTTYTSIAIRTDGMYTLTPRGVVLCNKSNASLSVEV